LRSYLVLGDRKPKSSNKEEEKKLSVEVIFRRKKLNLNFFFPVNIVNCGHKKSGGPIFSWARIRIQGRKQKILSRSDHGCLCDSILLVFRGLSYVPVHMFSYVFFLDGCRKTSQTTTF
jgi:hypothetical protein